MFCRLSTKMLGVALTAAIVAGCQSPDLDVLATWDGGRVTRAELDGWLSQLPSAQRQPPDNMTMERWLSERLGDLVLPQIVSLRAQTADNAGPPSIRLRARYEASQIVGREYLLTLCPSEEVSDERITEAFAAHFPQSPRPWIMVRHIYKRSLPSAPADQRRAVRSSLEQVLSALANGASFIEQARLHSDSDTAEHGGLIGRLSQKAPVEPAVLRAAWALDDDAYSDIVEVDNGFHIVLREESGVEAPQSLDEVRSQLERQLTLAQQEECGREVLTRLESQTPISIDRMALQSPAPDSIVLRIGDEEFSNLQLRGLAADGRQLAHTPRPGETLRHFSEAALLTSAATATDSQAESRFNQAESAAADRLIREAQWHAERRRYVLELQDLELQQYFERNQQRFYSDLQLDLGLLVVESDSPTERRQAFEQAQEIAARLRLGASFEQLAEELSVHWSSDQGGRLKLLPLPRVQVILGSNATTVASQLRVGEVSSPILIAAKPRARFALLKLFQRQEPEPQQLDQIRDQVVETLARERVKQLDQQVRERLLADSGLKISEISLGHYIEELSGL